MIKLISLLIISISHFTCFSQIVIKDIVKYRILFGEDNIADTSFAYKKSYNKDGILTEKEIPDDFGYESRCRVTYIYDQGILIDSTVEGLCTKESVIYDTVSFKDLLGQREYLFFGYSNNSKLLEKKVVDYPNGDLEITFYIYDKKNSFVLKGEIFFYYHRYDQRVYFSEKKIEYRSDGLIFSESFYMEGNMYQKNFYKYALW